MTEKDGGIFNFLVNLNPIAKLYKKILGVPDVIALSMAVGENEHREILPEKSQDQAVETFQDTQQTHQGVRLTARQRYGDEDHARRYGDYKAAHEIEKERRRHWGND